MIAKSTQSILVLGLAGSMVAAFAPFASAQTANTTSTSTSSGSSSTSTQAGGIQITGGQATGTAAFFVPTTDAAGNVRLFDIGIQTLQIQTNRGTTTTSVFTPGAASFTDANNNGKPDSGDTGVLQGTLAGTAFTSNGLPIVFTGRETLMNFTLNNFSSQVNLAGSLISPKTVGAAPLVFLPAVNATLASGSSFQASRGDLQVGNFKAGLDNGLINLPPTLAFRSGDSSVPTLPIFDLGRRIKFKFEGDNAPGNLTISANALRFTGEANKKVEIQSSGSGSSDQKFEFKSDVGYIDVALGGIDKLNIQGAGGASSSFKYNIEGESNGILSLYNQGSLAFSGTARRDTKFKFESGSLKVDGQSSGPVDFYATAGLGTSVNRDTTFTNFNPQSTQGSGSSSSSGACGICSSSLVPGSTLNFGSTVVTVGSPIVVNSSSQQQSGSQFSGSGSFFGSGSFGSSSSGSSGGSGSSESIRFLAYAGSANTDLFALSGNSRVSRTQYRILSSGKRSDRVRVVNRGNQRYYVVNRGRGLALGRREQAGFAQLGPNCRIFPGLVGLRQLSENELAAVNANNTENEDEGDDNSTSTNTGTSSGGSSTGTTSGGSSTGTSSGGSSSSTGTTSDGSSSNTNTIAPTTTEDSTTPTNTDTTTTPTEGSTAPTNTTPSSTSDTNSSSNTSGSEAVDANAAPSDSGASQSDTASGTTETPAVTSGLTTTNPQ